MLGKLLKEEIKSYCFPGAVVFAIGFIFTVFFKVATMMSARNDMRKSVVWMAGNMLYYILLLMVASVTVISVFRFYKTTISDCGYLTWTLPVKTKTVLWSKLIGAVLFKFVALAVFVVCILLFEIGNFKDMFQVSFHMNNIDVMTELGHLVSGKLILSIILCIVFVILEQSYTLLAVFFSMAIGQLAGKMRILASIACYIVISILHQIFMFIGMMMLFFSGEHSSFEMLMMRNDIFHMINGALVVMIIFIGVADAFYFIMTHYIFKNRLNLE